MDKRTVLCASLVLSLVFLSCSPAARITKPPDVRFGEITLSKEIEAETYKAVPKNPTTVFSSQDPEVIASLKIMNFWGSHTLRWDWLGPNGTLYYSTGDYPITSTEGKYWREVTLWHRLSIRGEEAGNLRGEWNVKIFFDKKFLAWKNFNIE